MSKKFLSLKRYLYISQGKIGMYASQLPRPWWQRLLASLSRLSRLKVLNVELEVSQGDVPSMHQKMQDIIKRLKQEHTFGTIDQPATYIQDTLPPTGCATRLMKLHFQGSNHLCERSWHKLFH